jgi:hypothetical protein
LDDVLCAQPGDRPLDRAEVDRILNSPEVRRMLERARKSGTKTLTADEIEELILRQD